MLKNTMRPLSLIVAILMVGALSISIFSRNASADQINARSLTLQAGATDGGSKPGGTVNHYFQFSTNNTTSTTVGSILFQYCTTATGLTCTTPPGLVTTSAVLNSQLGATGFTIMNGANGAPYITRTAASVAANTPLKYQLTNITNPTTPNQTFYVRITTFSGTDGATGPQDTGNVAASTATQIVLTGIMPESLVFCTGGTISTTVGVPDCSTATSGAVSFNQLFSPTDTAIATSQMAASTNAGSGYAITVNGPTLTSGLNSISGMNSATTSTHGISQFGLNLKQNTIPVVGTEVVPTSTGTNYRGEAVPSSGYDIANTFKFTAGDQIADSASGGAGGSDAQIFTTAYIANVPGSQPAGSYTTTLTYICTPTF